MEKTLLGKVWLCQSRSTSILLENGNNLSCQAKAEVFDRECERAEEWGWRTDVPTEQCHRNLGCEPYARDFAADDGRMFVPSRDQEVCPSRMRAVPWLESRGESS